GRRPAGPSRRAEAGPGVGTPPHNRSSRQPLGPRARLREKRSVGAERARRSTRKSTTQRRQMLPRNDLHGMVGRRDFRGLGLSALVVPPGRRGRSLFHCPSGCTRLRPQARVFLLLAPAGNDGGFFWHLGRQIADRARTAPALGGPLLAQAVGNVGPIEMLPPGGRAVEDLTRARGMRE